MSLDETGYRGTQRPESSNSQFNAQMFLIRAALARTSCFMLARVTRVTNSGGVTPVGFVDLQPLVNMVDGSGNSKQHGTIPECPYMRLQGGSSAVILDPQVGDIACVAFADRDISSVANNHAKTPPVVGPANPGSTRIHDMTDAVAVAFWSPHVPITQYVQFSAAGIKLHSPTAVVLEAPDVRINATTVEVNAGGAVAITSASLTHNGVNIGATHVHGGVQTGGSNTAVPH